MKKMLTVSAAVLALAVLSGCCNDKCSPGHCRTASCTDCCEEEKKDTHKNDGKTASSEDAHKNGKEKDPVAERSQKLSAR